jgi:ABC-type lipoprotein export system ATPase subunit
MNICVRNFRHYKGDRNFSFENTTFILGSSGSGKTSIIEAIYFCLTGQGKNIGCVFSSGKTEVEMSVCGKRIRRSRTNLWFEEGSASLTDEVAQAKIRKFFGSHFLLYSQTNANLFFELAPIEQLETIEEILLGEEVDLKDLKARFAAEKRTLESAQKELLNKQAATRGFLSRLGITAEHCESEFSPTRVKELKRRLGFARNRLSLQRQYQEKLGEVESSIQLFRKKIREAEEEENWIQGHDVRALEKHIESMKKLEEMGWRRYVNYPVEECDNEIRAYEADRAELVCAQSREAACPSCAHKLWIRGDSLLEAEEVAGKAGEILEEHGAATIEEALADIDRQIKLYSEFRNKRVIVDSLTETVISDLSLKEAQFELERINRKEQSRARCLVLRELLVEKEEQFAALRKCAHVGDWDSHSKEVSEIETFLQNAELFELRRKEAEIRREYEAEISLLTERADNCAQKIQGLARAQVVLADTEQEYVGEILGCITQEMNLYLSEMFQGAELSMAMHIEATSRGQKKLRIKFNKDSTEYLYEMFSGGEKARINLCFILTLANFQQNKILLLDEFSRFLDKDTAKRVFGVLKKYFKGHIIAAEHEAIFGSEFPSISLN